MNIYRSKNNGRMYKLVRVTPRRVLGEWWEAEDLIPGAVRKLNESPSRIWDSELLYCR